MPIVELDELYILAWLKLYLCKNDKYLQGMSEDSSNLKWIVNLDLDFFYYSDKCVKLQVFSDTYIKEVAKVLQKAMKNIQALTIAISPECLDGRNMKEKWDNGFRILKIMSEELPLLKKFPFPIE